MYNVPKVKTDYPYIFILNKVNLRATDLKKKADKITLNIFGCCPSLLKKLVEKNQNKDNLNYVTQ